MVYPISSVLTEQDEDIHEVNPANAVLLRRLGLEALPTMYANRHQAASVFACSSPSAIAACAM